MNGYTVTVYPSDGWRWIIRSPSDSVIQGESYRSAIEARAAGYAAATIAPPTSCGSFKPAAAMS